jgi:hypothetical protein
MQAAEARLRRLIAGSPVPLGDAWGMLRPGFRTPSLPGILDCRPAVTSLTVQMYMWHTAHM